MIDIVKISQALSDPIRHKILLMLLNHKECTSPRCPTDLVGVCNCEIMEQFGMIQSRVSYHMKELAESGLVTEIPQGKWKYYDLNKEALREYIKELGVIFQL
ncbi:MAG: metalloregulator ArsR/SmtB family transcription factor [Peptococcaceae bacterium]|nr:metalloregulator ArsR/SmtB family transcription factor [Peptococcaceae bacterium]